jgi:NAD(P)-dependent dehydrogenase (short-subunit alcohol dehydrogenase family)
MNNYFNEKIAVITGGANGIGLGLATELCRRGASVIIADILADDLRKAVIGLKAEGYKAAGYEMDVSREEQWPGLLDLTLETYGRVDYLFNNAGIMYTKPYDCFVSADWDLYFKVNVMGPVFGCNTFYPAMAKQGGGHISTVVSQAALGPLDGALIGAPYAPLKSACLTFVEQFAVMMNERKNGVVCSAIMPSIVNTDISSRMENPLARPVAFRDNPDIDNRSPEVRAASNALVKRLADPQTPEDKAMAFAMGVISVEQAVQTILAGIEKGYFYIYTHPGRSNAITRQEMDRRLAGYKQPAPQSAASVEYTKLSKSPV